MENYDYKYYLQDLIIHLKEKIENAYNDMVESGAEDTFLKGRVFAMYETLDLIKSQAIAFDIDLNDLGLLDYNLERFLIK